MQVYTFSKHICGEDDIVVLSLIHIYGWIEETISGMKSYNKRELGRLLLQIQKDDLIIDVYKRQLLDFSSSESLDRSIRYQEAHHLQLWATSLRFAVAGKWR